MIHLMKRHSVYVPQVREDIGTITKETVMQNFVIYDMFFAILFLQILPTPPVRRMRTGPRTCGGVLPG